MEPWLNEPISRRVPFHPQVAGGPDAGGTDVEGEDRVVGGEPVDGGRYVLRVQRRLVAPVGGQPVQPGPRPPVVPGHPVQVPGVGLDREQGQQRVDGVLHRAHQRDPYRHPTADPFPAHVDLDDGNVVREERPVGEVGTQHDQGVAVLHRPVSGTETDQSGHPHVVGIVVLDDVLAAERVDHRGLQGRGEGNELLVRPGASSSGQDGDPAGRVEHLGGGREHCRPTCCSTVW
jgi:hypothetical protein